MNLFRKLAELANGVFRKSQLDAEMDAEMRSHLEMRVQEYIEAGMNPRDAHIAAHRQFGWTESIKETCRDQRGVAWLENLLQDLRFGMRQLRKSPGFATVVVLTLAIGIGASTAIFSLFSAVLLKPLPYPNSDRIVAVTETNQKGFTHPASYPNFIDYREQNSVLAGIAGIGSTAYNLVAVGDPERVSAQNVTAGFFPVLGVQPLFGRWFTPEEDRPNSERVTIISYNLWRRRFAGRSDVVGKHVILDEHSYTIVGIMPRDFRSPTGNFYQSPNHAPELWTPLATDTTQSARYSWFLRVIGRLKPGVSIETASAELNVIAGRLAEQYPENNAGYGVRLRSLHQDLGVNARPTILLLTSAVTLLLMVACANVANLFLLRSIGRAGEITIRASLGAGRLRLVRQLLTESVLVSTAGGVLGVVLGWLGIHTLQLILPTAPASFQSAEMNITVVGFSLAVSLATGLIFGLTPALHSTNINLNNALKSGGKSTTDNGRNRKRNGFVIAEIALSFMLLAGAGLVAKSLGQLLKVDPGFHADNVLAMRIRLPGKKYDDSSKIRGFFDPLIASLSALPGVVSVGGVTDLPMTGNTPTTEFLVDGRPKPAPGELSMAGYQSVTPDYFRAMGIPLLSGRQFGQQDREHSPLVVLINREMATRFWSTEDPIGKSIRIGGTRFEIVGVVGDVRTASLNTPPRPEIYMPHSQQADSSLMIAVRASGNPLALSYVLREQISKLDGHVPLAEVQPLETAIANSTSETRVVTFLLSSFAIAAVGLAALGLYGVISYSVANRTREMGIRMAVGARAVDVSNMIIKQGLRVIFIGMGIGLAASLATSQLFISELYEVKITDPQTLAGVAAVLVGITLLALSIPARRAAKVQPIEALRSE